MTANDNVIRSNIPARFLERYAPETIQAMPILHSKKAARDGSIFPRGLKRSLEGGVRKGRSIRAGFQPAPRRPAVTTPTPIHYYIRGHIESQPVERLPGAHCFVEAFSTLDAATSFPQGLRLLLDSYETWLQPAPTAGRRRAK